MQILPYKESYYEWNTRILKIIKGFENNDPKKNFIFKEYIIGVSLGKSFVIILHQKTNLLWLSM
jgi:hypothetical protein